MLNRSEGGIDRRILELKLKERPLIASKNSQWTEEHFEILTEMIKQRKNYNQIAGCTINQYLRVNIASSLGALRCRYL